MPSTYLDIDQILSSAGKYHAASQHASAAQDALGAAALSAGALGGSAAAQSLAGALQSFRDAHTHVATSSAMSLVAFGERLNGVAGLGEETIAATTAAASSGWT